MNLNLQATQIGDYSGLTSTVNVPFVADFQRVVSGQAVWTSTTLSATINFQFSLDNTNWISFTSGTAITNTSSNAVFNIGSTTIATNANVDAPYWRYNVVVNSGTFTTLKLFVCNVARSR